MIDPVTVASAVVNGFNADLLSRLPPKGTPLDAQKVLFSVDAAAKSMGEYILRALKTVQADAVASVAPSAPAGNTVAQPGLNLDNLSFQEALSAVSQFYGEPIITAQQKAPKKVTAKMTDAEFEAKISRLAPFKADGLRNNNLVRTLQARGKDVEAHYAGLAAPVA